MNIHTILETFIKPFRKRRMARFLHIVNPVGEDRILDVGGTLYNWQLIGYRGHVTLLNVTRSESELPDNFSYVVGDGTALKYKNKEFDILFSNSVIEHVGSFEMQKMFAAEALRVAKCLWVQTPAREFFFEPHLLTPFIHWFSKGAQKRLLRNFTLWGLIARPDQSFVDKFVDSTRLLTFKELKELFPGCQVLRETFCFATKSYIIVRV